MTLLKFIQETLPELAKSIQDPSCDHILIATRQGRWHTLRHGSWQRHPHDLSTEALAVLTQMCDATAGDDNLVKPFEIQQLSPDTIALARRVYTRHLTLPASLEESLQKALIQGANALIFGPPSAPKEELLERIAAHIPGEPAIFITSRQLEDPPPNHILLDLPIDAPARTLQLQQTLRLASAVFWEMIPSIDHLARLFSSQPGVQKRWCSLDTFDPEAALLAISHTHASDAIDLLVWVEPHYHANIPPVILSRQDDTWITRSDSMLSHHLLECANRLLSRQASAVEPRAKAAAPPRQSSLEPPTANNYGDLRITADISDLKLPAPSHHAASEVDQQSFSSLLQTHVSPENHLLSTHPGFGSRTRQEEEEGEPEHREPRFKPQDEDVTEAIPLDRIQMLSSMASSQETHTAPSIEALPFDVLPPDMAREHIEADEAPTQQPATDDPLTLEQHADPLLLDELVDEDPIIIADADLDDLPELDLLSEEEDALPHDPLAVTSAYTPHVERPQDPFSDLDDARSRHPRILDELAQEEDEHTQSAPAPYDELKRMERELMTAAHDETTGLHHDFLDQHPSPAATPPRSPEEEHISTPIQGSSPLSLPDDPEVFSSLNHSHEERPRRPEPPAGLWQPDASANEPTQMLDLFDDQDEPPALSWDDDEHTKQRNQDDASHPPSSETSTSTKLSTLSDRIKALRERQRHGDS